VKSEGGRGTEPRGTGTRAGRSVLVSSTTGSPSATEDQPEEAIAARPSDPVLALMRAAQFAHTVVRKLGDIQSTVGAECDPRTGGWVPPRDDPPAAKPLPNCVLCRRPRQKEVASLLIKYRSVPKTPPPRISSLGEAQASKNICLTRLPPALS